MVFKRKIDRNGKKLGPSYSEKVRGSDESIKTGYTGISPSNHPKHKIRKPLFFIIFVLLLILILGGSLFLLQNKAYIVKKVNLQPADFDVDQILLKVLVKSNEFIEKQVRIMNTEDTSTGIDIDVSSLSDIVKVDSSSFTIKPGQTKIVTLNFSSFNDEQKTEQQPGIYVGKLVIKSERAAKEIPIIVEIETKNVLFDLNLNPLAFERKVKQGSDATIEVRIFNLESIESGNVDVEYFVKDMNGNTIITESETVVVKTQASFFKTISIPKNLKPGPYVFAAQAKFGNSVGTASYLFEVTSPEAEAEASFVQFCKNSILCLGLSLTTILLLFALTAYFYFFIGAYLYEKVTGVITLPGKRKEEEMAEEVEAGELGIFETRETQSASVLQKFKGFFSEIKNKFEGWRKERGLAKEDKAKMGREEELRVLAEEKRNQEELRKKKKLEAEQREEQIKKGLDLKKNFKEFFHKIGFARTPEEKRQTDLQNEKEKQEKLRMEEEKRVQEELKKYEKLEKKQKELSKLKQGVNLRFGFFRNFISRYKQKIQERRKEREEKKAILETAKSVREELKQKEPKEKITKEAKKPKQEEKFGLLEEEIKKKLVDEKLPVREIKPSWFERLFKKEPEFKFREMGKKPEEEHEAKKTDVFGKLFGKILTEKPIEEKEKPLVEKIKPEEQKKPKTEIEELEEAIRSLDLFKKIEEGEKGAGHEEGFWVPKEKKPGIFSKLLKKGKLVKITQKEEGKEEQRELKAEPEKKIIVKSKKLEQCHNILNEVKEALDKNDIPKAKKLYAEARNIYLESEYKDKKEVYDELMEMYDKIKNL